MKLSAIWKEWTICVTSERVTYPCLRDLEEERVAANKSKRRKLDSANSYECYHHQCLVTAIERRVGICRFVEKMSKECGSTDEALVMVDALMTKIGKKGKHYSLCQI